MSSIVFRMVHYPPTILHGVLAVEKEVNFHLYLHVKFDKSDRIIE